MKKLRRRLFILAIFFAMLSSGGVYVYLKSLDDRPVIEAETFTIIVASRDIAARTKITEDMVEELEVTYEPEVTQFYQRKEDVVGQYVVTKIYEGSQFHKSNLDFALEEELSLKISGNMRAVSISVSGQNGVANLIKPGDRVDIIVYLPEIKESQIVIRPDIAKMLLQNVEVLAIDQDLTSEEDTVIDEANVDNSSQKMYIATLAVPVQDVEMLILAKDIGALDLVLRPLEGDFIYASEGIIWQELLIDDYDRLKDMFPNYEVNSVGEVIVKADAVQYDKYIYYTVEYGDTLKEISMLFYGTEEYYLLLKQVNNIEDEDIISAGMGLKIPVIEDRGEIIEQN
ncbi:MAG: Flp pilus assembly protein CpaB [Clostridia bacterium]|nr:Flp pilus assembly protein CpaB [Clostridia bacterium]